MASKGMHVQDNSVVERRLRPVYESLDSGNNKKALQECDKVLKKTPNLQCAKALKALALLRMGKESECVGLLEGLTNEKPSDDATLQAMTLCYRDLQRLEKICRLYENAVKIDPNNEELHTHLFMSYVRISDFKSQQQSAMALYKLKPRNPYYCWAVMSIILQATRGSDSGDPLKRNLLLSLAERMIDKLICDNKLEAEQEAQLYVMVLELQVKYEEILKVLEGSLGTKLLSGSLSYSVLPYLLKLRKWPEVNLYCKNALVDRKRRSLCCDCGSLQDSKKLVAVKSVDKWNIWKEYVNSVFEIMSSEPHSSLNNHLVIEPPKDDLETVDDTPEKAHEFICRLVENGADNGYLLRGPYLARFELCSKLSKHGMDATDLLGETIELFVEYFRKFGHKACCVSDLRGYLSLLDPDKKVELSSRLIKDVGISSTSVPQSEQQMQRHICALQLSRLCGSHRNLSLDHLKALVTALSLHYQHGYQTYGLNLLPTDQGPSDSYALLAAHVLYDLSQTTQSSEPIILGLVLLENLLKNSPSNFHAKLLGIKFYHYLGGGVGAQTMYDSLDIKHLQLDSLGYIHCGRLQTTGLLNLATALYDTTLKFFSSNYKDSSDHLTFSYKFGSFLKLEEFMDFRERLNNSLHYTTVAVDRIMLTLVNCTTLEGLYNVDTVPKENKINWEELRDNRDLNVFHSWDPERVQGPPETSAEITEHFKQDVCFLKLRSYILWCMSAAIDIAKSADGTRNKSIDLLKSTVKDWEDECAKACGAKHVPIAQNQVTLPLPSRLHGFLNAPYQKILVRLFKLVISITLDDTETSSKLIQDVQNSYREAVEFASARIDEQNTSQDCHWMRRGTMEYIVNLLEIICVSSLLCLLCNDIIRPSHTKKARRKTMSESGSREALCKLVVDLKQTANNLDGLLGSWSCGEVICDLSDRLCALNLNANGQNEVLDNLKNSHIMAVRDLRGVLKGKHKSLGGLLA